MSTAAAVSHLPNTARIREVFEKQRATALRLRTSTARKAPWLTWTTSPGRGGQRSCATRRVARQAPQVQAYLDTRLRYALKRRFDKQVINGDGNSPNISTPT